MLLHGRDHPSLTMQQWGRHHSQRCDGFSGTSLPAMLQRRDGVAKNATATQAQPAGIVCLWRERKPKGN